MPTIYVQITRKKKNNKTFSFKNKQQMNQFTEALSIVQENDNAKPKAKSKKNKPKQQEEFLSNSEE